MDSSRASKTLLRIVSQRYKTAKNVRSFVSKSTGSPSGPVQLSQAALDAMMLAEKNVSDSKEKAPWDWQRMVRSRQRRAAVLEYFSQLGSTQNRDNTYQPHHGLSRPDSSESLTLSALVAAGAHIGHSPSLMFPSFLPYAYGTRAGVTIIDLEQTLPMLRRAANVVRAIAQNDGMILFVGTTPMLRPIVAKAAGRLGPNGFHVGERWLPGTLTNRMGLFGTEVARSKKLKPDCVIFLNPLSNLHAIRECATEHIPTIGITDSNADPRIVMYSIPANDESIRTAEIVAGVLSLAGQQGIKWRDRPVDSLEDPVGLDAEDKAVQEDSESESESEDEDVQAGQDA